MDDKKGIDHWEKRVAYYKDQIARTRKLHKNVLFRIELVDEADVMTRAISSREELETMREFCGLAGCVKG